MTATSRTTPTPLRNAKPADSTSKLENLYKTLKELRKQLRSLHEQLESAGSIAERMAIRRQITAVEEMVETVRRQIMLITQLDKRTQVAKLEMAGLDDALATDEVKQTEDATGSAYKPSYDLSD